MCTSWLPFLTNIMLCNLVKAIAIKETCSGALKRDLQFFYCMAHKKVILKKSWLLHTHLHAVECHPLLAFFPCNLLWSLYLFMKLAVKSSTFWGIALSCHCAHSRQCAHETLDRKFHRHECQHSYHDDNRPESSIPWISRSCFPYCVLSSG